VAARREEKRREEKRVVVGLGDGVTSKFGVGRRG
jgi:hypothetical protein